MSLYHVHVIIMCVATPPQRKRWLYGLTLTFWSSRIPAKCKVGLFFMVWAWTLMPFTSLNIVCGILYPFGAWRFFDVLCAFSGTTYVYLFMFGAAKSFSLGESGLDLPCRDEKPDFPFFPFFFLWFFLFF